MAWYLFILKLLVLWLFISPFINDAFALNELFETYNAPQELGMGGAITADAYGYLANFYNPAGLGKAPKRKFELILLDFEVLGGLNAFGPVLSSQSLGINRLFGPLKDKPGRYNYFRFTTAPAFSMRGYGGSLLFSYQYAAQSDGTQIDINATEDLVPTFGLGVNLAGNLLKLGLVGKLVIRNQLKGVFDHSVFNTDDDAASLMKEGWAVGADAGLLLTYPYTWLPSLGVVWKDVLDTHFRGAIHLLNRKSNGIPDPIRQSVNAAASVHPYFTRTLRSTLAIEWRHIERPDLPFRKRIHIGFQLEDEKSFYVWAGLNQLYWTVGLALRVPGGNIEVGTYGEDIGEGDASKEDRRIFFRWTISF
ncbi:MAG: hypothetical protein HY537_07190 [Deltaproteobacteria bacterium]|nr:hypothetical protein [Deltaproteobacteria bacterium]